MKLTAIALMLLPGMAFADGITVAEVEPSVAAPLTLQSSPDLVFTLRGGLQARPEYFGSEDFRVGPDLGFGFQYGRAFGREFGSLDGARPQGFRVSPSFRFLSERSADDYPELSGLGDIDAALELGFGARYSLPNFEVFADVRRGFGGHEALVGEVGADVILDASDRVTFRVGPRVQLGDEDFTGTYFGVTGAEAAASSFSAYDPEGGIVSAGVELGVTYQFNETWGLEGTVRYDRFQGDVANSPIVQDEDQLSVSVGITRRITLDF